VPKLLSHLSKKLTKRQIEIMDNKLDEKKIKEKKILEEELEKEHAVIFKKRELILIFNLLTTLSMKYGDFIVVNPIIKKLEPIVAVASNIPQKDGQLPNPSLIGLTKENN
jgi:hypothetical protein